MNIASLMTGRRVPTCRRLRTFALLLASLPAALHAALPPGIASQLDAMDVTWTTPGPTALESMPIGNGDIGLNVWVETSGALNFYIGKTDAWSENYMGDRGVYKVGGVRVSLSPNPFTSGTFSQTLKLRTGEMVITENGTTLRVWVDANNPVIRVEVASPQPVSVTAELNNWRNDPVVSGQTNRVVWYHRNPSNADVNLRDRTFGAGIWGSNLVSQSSTVLTSASAATSHLLSVVPLTTATATTTQWLDQLNQKISQVSALDLASTRTAHQSWWDAFWDRSWIFATGDAEATAVSQGHALQRFITACGGRGAYPIKFNGSIFVVENPAANRDQDSRSWGGRYWFQNTRSPYWPRLMAGDFEMMLPLFDMYAAMLVANAPLVTGHYGHGGSYFAETTPFWGGLGYWGPEVEEHWTGHYFSAVLELTMMMLDYYEYTGDAAFAQQTLVPTAKLGLQFYNEHFPRDAQGKLLLDPVNAIETYWKAHNPAPDVAGLRAILARMLTLPTSLVDSSTRATWTTLQSELPPLPIGVKAGKDVLLPYTGPQTMPSKNGENPELYAVFPYRLYGLGRSNLKLATDSFNARKSSFYGGWTQDPIQSAMLGLSEVARSYVVFNFTDKEPRLKFPGFWRDRHDYAPNQCTGGNAEYALQNMIMQADNGKILLLPAWPQGWNGDFKLRAPGQTTLQGSIVGGKVTNLVVTPASRAADVIDMSSLTAESTAGYGIVSTVDAVQPLKQTLKGGANTFAASGEFGGVGGAGELVPNIRDANLNTKHFNKSQNGSKPKGIDSGFVIRPVLGSTIVTGFRMASANDMDKRDPQTITIEGSNTANADQAGGGGFSLLYEGPAGLLSPDRKAWGLSAVFANATPYSVYRVLVTSTRGAATSDATQYSEIQLLGDVTTPPPGSNIVSPSDVVLGLSKTGKGGVNVAAISGTDHSAGEPATNVRDGNVNTKYYNNSQHETAPKGVNTGFAITPAAGPKAINGFQFATGNDMPGRDPLTITIEGSNASNADQPGGNGFVLVWEGTSGLDADPGRKQWGQRISFYNPTAYQTYRVLVTGTFQSNAGAQYSDVRLFAP